MQECLEEKLRNVSVIVLERSNFVSVRRSIEFL